MQCNGIKIQKNYQIVKYAKIYMWIDKNFDYEKVIKKMYFMFECLKRGEKLPFTADYFTSKCPPMFGNWKKIQKILSCCPVAENSCNMLRIH